MFDFILSLTAADILGQSDLIALSIFGLFGSAKKTSTTSSTSNVTTTDIDTTNQNAAGGSIIAGENAQVVVTDGGAIRGGIELGQAALDANVQANQASLDLAGDAIFSTAALADRFGERNTELVTETLGRESLLTSQVLSSIGSTFTENVGNIATANQDFAGAISDITNSGDTLKAKQSQDKTLMIGAIALAAIFFLPKLIKKG